MLERSLEYRNDLFLDIKIVRYIERNYPEFLVGATYGLAHALVFPQIGYVQKPINNVMLYGFKATHGIKDFMKIGLNNIDPKNTIWIGFQYDNIIRDIDYPVGKYDKIIKEFIH